MHITYTKVLEALENVKTITHYHTTVDIVGDNKKLQNYIANEIENIVWEIGNLPKQTSNATSAGKLHSDVDDMYKNLIKSLLLLGRDDEAQEIKDIYLLHSFDDEVTNPRYYTHRRLLNDIKNRLIQEFINKFNISKTNATRLATAIISTV